MKTQKTAEKFRNKMCADSVIVSILCSLFERARTRERQLYDCSTEFTLNCWRGLPPTANIIYSIDLAIDSQPKCSRKVYRRICIYFTINKLYCFYWRLWLTTLFQMSINDQIRKQQHDPSKIKQHNDNIDVTNLYISNLPRSFTEEVCLNLSFLCLSSPNFNILRYLLFWCIM